MKVMKFGGTSVGSANGIRKVCEAVSANKEEVIVAVSALSGITDQLLKSAKLATTGNEDYKTELEQMITRHNQLIEEVVSADKQLCVKESVEKNFEELNNILSGIYLIKDLSDKTLATIVSYGERLSSVIIAAVIPGAKHLDSREFIKTKYHFAKCILDMETTDSLVKEAFADLAPVTVIPGFISTDTETGDITNLGRGGSDYTAAIVAATLNASILEIWTDVDGFMTADPRLISNAYVIERLSFVEAMELCNFGAKVIYPPTIFPVYHKDIPIVIKNTFNQKAKGTLITKKLTNDKNKAIKGISSINDTCLITVQGLGMVGVTGVNYRIFKTLAKVGISVFFVSQASSENTTSIGVKNSDADLAIEVLKEEFAQEMSMGEINNIKKEMNLATVAIVGENMKHTPGIAGKLFGTLGRNGINVIACAQGASETNISFVIALDNLNKTMNVIHDSFFLSDYQVLNVFVAGSGLVGSNLLEQIAMQQPKLLKENSLKINVVGITNSKRYIMNREGLNLEDFKGQLAKSENVSSPEIFAKQIIEMNIFNSVFVDCTASADVATVYKNLLESNISVVAANKIAASSEYDSYLELKAIARKRGIKFLFETNVGAGLPIINTISDLINSGDKILKIEAVVSGTLNYIFNEMSETVPMSRAIMMAKEAGYAEPDPRIDLSGQDVIRKLVILAREAGYPLEQEDVEKKLFIPSEMFKGSVDEFWKNITNVDAEFEKLRSEVESRGNKLRFIATLDNGKGSVALREVESDSPFFALAGSNNVISLTTERYKEYPMQIKGYGAGASVTAAGVFADIISIANIR